MDDELAVPMPVVAEGPSADVFKPWTWIPDAGRKI